MASNRTVVHHGFNHGNAVVELLQLAWSSIVVRRIIHRKHYLVFGILLSLIAGIGVAIARNFGVDSDIATACVLLPLIGLILGIDHEIFNIDRITVFMVAIGSFVAITYYGLLYFHVTTHVRSDNGLIGYIIYFVNISFIIPYFEEVVVRKYLFVGLWKFVGFLASALLVSAAFGLAHSGAMLWAFCFSLFMCYLVYRDIDTANRAVLHGAFNLTFGALLIVGTHV